MAPVALPPAARRSAGPYPGWGRDPCGQLRGRPAYPELAAPLGSSGPVPEIACPLIQAVDRVAQTRELNCAGETHLSRPRADPVQSAYRAHRIKQRWFLALPHERQSLIVR
jgi:hypothetical protein